MLSVRLSLALCLLMVAIAASSEDIYQAPKLKLNSKKGQTVVRQETKWESGQKIEYRAKQRSVASEKTDPQKKNSWERNPSSQVSPNLEYWQYNPKQP